VTALLVTATTIIVVLKIHFVSVTMEIGTTTILVG